MESLSDFILYVFVGFTLINCFFYVYLSRFCLNAEKNDLPDQVDLPPISIVICAKNEAKNLKNNIPFLLQQDYPKFEILLINDVSSDSTLEVMQDFARLSPAINIVDIACDDRHLHIPTAGSGGKKYALTQGIKNAKYPHLLFIDADCHPISDKWIRKMASGFSGKKSIVLGYGAYKKIKTSLLNKIIRFETLLTAIQYFGYAEHKNPYMGVGRNLGYTKTLFKRHRGFQTHEQVASGDDDLFINMAATATNTSIVYEKISHTLSEPKKTWRAWFRQKRRHTDVSHLYRTKHKLQLTGFYISQFIFITLFVPIAFIDHFSLAITVFIIMRYAIVWTVIAFGAEKLGEKDLIYYFPLIELFLIPLQLSIFISNLICTQKNWS